MEELNHIAETGTFELIDVLQMTSDEDKKPKYNKKHVNFF